MLCLWQNNLGDSSLTKKLYEPKKVEKSKSWCSLSLLLANLAFPNCLKMLEFISLWRSVTLKQAHAH